MNKGMLGDLSVIIPENSTFFNLFYKDNDIAILLNTSKKILDINPIGEVFLQSKKTNLLGKSLISFRTEKIPLPTFLDKNIQAEVCEDTNHIEEQRAISWRIVPIFSNQILNKFLLLGKNITVHKPFQNSIKNTESMLDLFINIVPGYHWWKDLEGRYLGCNDAVAKLLGLNSSRDVIGKTDYELAWAENADYMTANDEKVIELGVQISDEEVITANGTTFTFFITKMPLKNSNSEIIGTIGTSIDITEQKRKAEELRIAKEEAEAANLSKSILISNIGHDLKTPFIGIEGHFQLLRDLYYEQDPDLKVFWDQALASIREIRTIINAIVDTFAMKHPAVELLPLSINKIIEAIGTLLLPTALSKSIELVINKLDLNESDIIDTDELRLKLILNILVSNAIKFTEKGKVTISVLMKDEYCHIKISDTGIGIPKEQFAYIFEPFSKISLSNTCNTFQGIGGGLYSGQIKAKELGAIIEVESELGKGSTFTFIIPIHPKK